jgi:hypothetical protein
MAWVNPNYEAITGRKPPGVETQDDPGLVAPQDHGHRLATIPRSSKGAEEELRVSLASYRGHDFLSLRVWQRDDQGRWWPQKAKGCSVRLSEADDVAEALKAGRRIADRDRPAQPGKGPHKPATRQPAREQREFPPERAAGGEGFSEFD